MDKLKPCPFCGSKDVKATIKRIECRNCLATYFGMPDNDLDTMREGWNTRHQDEQNRRLREALKNIAFGEFDQIDTAYEIRAYAVRALSEEPKENMNA